MKKARETYTYQTLKEMAMEIVRVGQYNLANPKRNEKIDETVNDLKSVFSIEDCVRHDGFINATRGFFAIKRDWSKKSFKDNIYKEVRMEMMSSHFYMPYNEIYT